jgi:hypothetical protein
VPRALPAWARWGLVVAAGAAATAALLLPASASQRGFLEHIRASNVPGPATWWACAQLAFGTTSHAVTGALLATGANARSPRWSRR